MISTLNTAKNRFANGHLRNIWKYVAPQKQPVWRSCSALCQTQEELLCYWFIRPPWMICLDSSLIFVIICSIGDNMGRLVPARNRVFSHKALSESLIRILMPTYLVRKNKQSGKIVFSKKKTSKSAKRQPDRLRWYQMWQTFLSTPSNRYKVNILGKRENSSRGFLDGNLSVTPVSWLQRTIDPRLEKQLSWANVILLVVKKS